MPLTWASCGRSWVVRSRTIWRARDIPLIQAISAGERASHSTEAGARSVWTAVPTLDTRTVDNLLRFEFEWSRRSHRHVDKVRYLPSANVSPSMAWHSPSHRC